VVVLVQSVVASRDLVRGYQSLDPAVMCVTAPQGPQPTKMSHAGLTVAFKRVLVTEPLVRMTRQKNGRTLGAVCAQ
jgi:hypothetical protein